MQFNHAKASRMDATTSSVAALGGRKERIKADMDRGNAISRNALREMLKAAKNGVTRKPRPEEIAQKLGDTLRYESFPFKDAYEILAVMKEDGLSYADARVFAYAISVGYVDAIYDHHELPSLDEACRRSAIEDGQADGEESHALITRSPADFGRALDERREAIVWDSIKERRLADEAQRKLAPR